MPEGLAQTMTDQDLVDLLAYLTTLRQPVSIVGPVPRDRAGSRGEGRARQSTRRARSTSRTGMDDGRGHKLSWRRLNANAEGLADLSALVAGDAEVRGLCLHPVVSPVAQNGPAGGRHARPRSRSGSMASRWHSPRRSQEKNEPRTALIDLPEGSSALLIRVRAGG